MQRLFADLNGKPVVGFNISRTKGASETTVAKGVETKLAELANAQIPSCKIYAAPDICDACENIMVSLLSVCRVAVARRGIFFKSNEAA